MGYLLRDVNYYRFRNFGPSEYVLLMVDGTRLDIPNVRDRSCWPVLDQLQSSDIVGVCCRATGDGDAGWTARYCIGNMTHYLTGVYEKDDAIRLCLKEWRGRQAAEDAILANPVQHLERELSRHDWYYVYSDDAGVFHGGEQHFKLIRELLQKVPEAKRVELWQKHAPKDFILPV